MATKKKSKKAAKKKSKPVRKGKAVKPTAAKKKAKKSAKSFVKPAAKKALPQKRAAHKSTVKKAAAKKFTERKIRGKADRSELVAYEDSGRGARTGGQSGDTQGLSGMAETNSESVRELLEEGQSFEAEVVGGVENAPEADEGEVRTHEVPEDDVPEEYLGKDQ